MDVVAIHLRDIHEMPDLTQEMVSKIKNVFTNGKNVVFPSEAEEPILKEFK